MVSTPYSPAKGLSSVPGQGTKVLQAVQPKEKEKNKINKIKNKILKSILITIEYLQLESSFPFPITYYLIL